jgi:PAS domain S-box-containing protein
MNKQSISPDKFFDEAGEPGGLDYRALFEQAAGCVFVAGLDFKFVAANSQALRLLGYEERQFSGLPLGEVVLLDGSQRESLFGKRQASFECALKRGDGSLLPVELNASVVHKASGQPAYVQFLARDISERKQTEASLKRHTRALSVMGEVSAALFRSADLQTKFPEVLESLSYAMDVFCCALLEITDSALRIQAQWTNAEEDGFDVEATLAPFLDSIREGARSVFSVTGVRVGTPDSSPISILVVPIQGTLGCWGSLALFDRQNQLSWLNTNFDAVQTTANLIGAAMDRLHYEKTIRLSEMRNRVLVDALPDLLIRADLSGRILDYSVHPSHPLYLQRDSVIGLSLSKIWPSDVVNMIMEPDASDTFVASHWVYGFSLPNHEQIFEARLHPISPEEALIVVRDITEQARLDQMKTDFINRASHELRTPLTAAMLMVELLQAGGSDEERAEYLNALTSELSRQKQLVDQLLLAGRLESGRMKIDPAPMDLLPVLKEAVKAVKVIADKRKTSIHLHSDGAAIPVIGDRSALLQVFINLVNNAVKFSPERTIVEVIAQTDVKGETRVLVIDHGLGIPPDALPHLFERFYRARNVTVAEIPGSGVGLYIVKSIVDELGGRIEVKSELNQGTTFVISLRQFADR